MKLMIASDLHGSAYWCRKMLEAFDREGAHRLLFLGDVLYHGPRNALPRDYDPKTAAELLNRYKDRILCLQGNCDSEVDQLVLEFPIMAEHCVLPFGDRLIYATHGHHFNALTPPPLCPGDILLHGHTHVPTWESFGADNLCLNPGSVSIPKEDSPHSYMLLEGGELLWKDLEGAVYHTLTL